MNEPLKAETNQPPPPNGRAHRLGSPADGSEASTPHDPLPTKVPTVGLKNKQYQMTGAVTPFASPNHGKYVCLYSTVMVRTILVVVSDIVTVSVLHESHCW